MRTNDHFDTDLPRAAEPPVAHPLAHALIAALGDAGGRIRLVGYGSGRNVPPFLAAGFGVDVLEADRLRAADARARFGPAIGVTHATYEAEPARAEVERYAGLLSTHALLHGTAASQNRTLAALHSSLARGATLCATFGSVRDPRFERGDRIDSATYAPSAGSEAGIPHVFYDRERLETLLRNFTILEAREVDATATVGRWAHAGDAASTIVHWYVTAVAG